MPPSLSPRARWRALDVFRGLVVLGMILVNAADLNGHAYAWLAHARWDGCTLADSVFPGFLFIMGVAMGVSLHGHVRGGMPLRRIYPRIVRRALLLCLLGLMLNACFATSLQSLRIMGVLQRLGLCYLLAAPILLHLSQRAQLFVAGGLLLGYWLALALVPVPQFASEASNVADNLPAYIDRWLLHPAHLLDSAPYNGLLDPEGVLGTFSALVNVLFGAFAGRLLAAGDVSTGTSARLAALGGGALLIGLCFGFVMPINKALWTSSFVLVTSGIAAIGLAFCYELVDVRGHTALAQSLEALGTNAIAAYLLSTAIDALVVRVNVETAYGARSLYDCWLSGTHLPLAEGALLFAILHALLVWAFAQALQARHWYLKI